MIDRRSDDAAVKGPVGHRRRLLLADAEELHGLVLLRRLRGGLRRGGLGGLLRLFTRSEGVCFQIFSSQPTYRRNTCYPDNALTSG